MIKLVTLHSKYALFILFFLFLSSTGYAQVQEKYLPGDLIVMLAESATIEDFHAELARVEDISSLETRRLSYAAPIYLVHYPAATGREQTVIERMQQFTSIYAAQLNYKVENRLTPNDAGFSQQWGLNNTGQTGGTADADVDAPEAWNVTTGGLTSAGDTIVVAIVDAGVQLTHPDLAPNLWKNYGEIAGNGVDDDGNGYVDDINGWDAYNNDGSIPSDQHGTHVAGIIGARGDNSTGVSGMNWNVKLMNIAGSSGSTATVITAYSYALQQRRIYNSTNGAQGAFVVAINSSFGVDFGQPSNYPIWCAFYDTMGAAGILNVAATANMNTNVDVQGDIPTACPSNYLVSVTNSTHNDVKNTGAAYGATTIDLAAPGTSIYSTVTGSGYANLTGTSMATPMVTGIIALMYSYPCVSIGTFMHQNPSGFALMVKDALLNSVDPLTAFSANTVSGGRANASKALDSMGALCAQVLPLGVHDFTVRAEQCDVILGWSSEAAAALQSFEIEGSNDGRTFSHITTVAANQDLNKYHHKLQKPDYSYYRLRVNSKSGASEYTAVAKVTLRDCGFSRVSVYPNPLVGDQWIVKGGKEGQTVKLFDIYGRIVRQMSLNGKNDAIDAADLPNGVYFMQVKEGGRNVAQYQLNRL